jgi:hypothetical protein
MPSDDLSEGAEIIDAYTRREAIEDGILVQLSGRRKREQVQFAGTALRVLRTNWTCPLFRRRAYRRWSRRPVSATPSP